ncbi:hypothetical protein V8F20_003008 [Naviculisporaceae sp. PSN 640]
MANNTISAVLESSNCSIAGNPDLLGLGIRLTIYLQAITSALSAAFLDQQYDYLQSSGIIFFIATLAILIREVSNASIRAPEASCVFWLLVLLALSLQNASRVRSRAYGREAVRHALLAATVLYASWFWFVGVDKLERPKKTTGAGVELCEEWAYWMVRSQDMRGEDYIKTQKVIYVMSSVIWCCWCCWCGYKHVRGALDSKKKLLDDLNDRSEPLANRIKDVKEKADRSGNPWSKLLVFMFSAGLVLLIAGIFLSSIVPAVERQIQWNDIQGVQTVDSVGQLAPLILAVGMLLHVLYSIFRGKDEFKEDWEKESGKSEEIPECPQRHKRHEQQELLERDSRYTANMD